MGIFISYSHPDKNQVESIVNILNKNTEHEIWYDNELRGGDHYFSVIAEQILKNEYFIFVVSRNSVASEWCRLELQFAMSEKRKIIAIWLEETPLPPVISLIIQNTHYINRYSGSDDDFTQNIISCFSVSAEKYSKSSKDEEFNSGSEKYFLKKSEISMVEKLLLLERQNKYSECFKPENAVLLGIAYETGIKTEKDLLKAEFYYKVGVFKENQDAVFLYAALMSENDKDNTKVYLKDMLTAANNGSTIAMTKLGDAYYNGKYSLATDKKTAVSLWKRAAAAGNVEAQYFMAYAYRWGEGVEKDYGIALMYAYSALEFGYPKAYRILGLMHATGEFVNKNPEEAKHFYQDAIDAGDLFSLCYLGKIYEIADRNYDEAFRTYTKATEYADSGKLTSGHPYYCLAMCHLNGYGTPQDTEKALEYLLKAAQRSHRISMRTAVPIADTLESREKRIDFLIKASEYNCDGADYRLGLTYEINDTDEAVKCYTKGAEKGDIACIQALLSGYYALILSTEKKYINHEKALTYFRLLFSLAENKDIEEIIAPEQQGKYYYAYAVELDTDTASAEPDYNLALYYFRKSLEKGYIMPELISLFVIGRFLSDEKWIDATEKTINHCEQVLSMAEPFILKKFDDAISKNNNLSKAEMIKIDTVIKGYTALSQAFRRGKNIPKDKQKQLYYSLKAEEFAKYKNLKNNI